MSRYVRSSQERGQLGPSNRRSVRFVPSLARVALGSFVVLAVLLIGGALPALSSRASVGNTGVTLKLLTPGARQAAPGRLAARHAVPLRVQDPAAFRQEKAAAERRYELWRQRRGLAPTTAAPAPRTAVSGTLNQPGITDAATTGTPSDSTGAIGPSNYVEFINSEIGVYSNTNLSATTATLDESTFVGAPSAFTCDPQIQWDEQGQRWLYAALDCDASLGSEVLYFGWSKTASPTSLSTNWCQFALSTGTSIEDYPRLGHDDSQIIIGTNAFDDSTLDYTGSHIFVFDKPANGVTTCPSGPTEASTKLEASAGTGFTPVTANIADSSSTGYVVAVDDDQAHLDLYSIGRSGGNNAVLGTKSVTVPAFDAPAPVPQPGTSDAIDSLDSRLTQAVAITDPATGQEGIWTQHTIAGPNGGPSVVRWYELTPSAFAPRQTGIVNGPSGTFAFNGAVSPASDGTSAVIFYNSGSSSRLVDMRVQDRRSDTTLGTTFEDLQLATSSHIDADLSCPSQDPTVPSCRWGDYAGASPDPSNACLVWGTSMLTVDSPDGFGTPQWGTQNAAIDVCGFTVSVTKSGTGSGTVTSSPAAISCGSTCSRSFGTGSTVTLTATPATGSAFSGWSGDCSGTGSCILSMSQARSVTAAFTFFSETLSVSTSGTGSGTVSSSPAGISCGSTCAHTYTFGTSVTLTAAPAADSVFSGWSGACSGTGTCTVSMSQAKSVIATFTLTPETLSVSKSGSGTVSSSPAGISCGATCSSAYAHGTSVTLTATSASGSRFAGWSGACSGTGTCSVTMNQAESVSAKFTLKRLCIVPKLKGKSVRAAKRALAKAHCRAGRITKKYSKVRRGRVISQKPWPGKHLAVGAKVNLVVSKGKKP